MRHDCQELIFSQHFFPFTVEIEMRRIFMGRMNEKEVCDWGMIRQTDCEKYRKKSRVLEQI